jgi:hypothetical protein
MKKTAIALATVLTSLTAHADEGMWTLYNLPQAVYSQMQAEGFTLPYEKLYGGENAIKNSVVNFGGFCSGVVVSPNGLVFTNHHCGFSAISDHSTPEHDYLKDGFVARSYEEELPNKSLFVSFMIEQKDITAYLDSIGLKDKKQAEIAFFVDSIENILSKEAKEKDSTLRLEIKPFYEGNKYYATTYRDFTDVRLVFTIPKSMGKFGGETDNWMWPRQTCDYAVFRIYADPQTNGPAKYSKDNVPYRPESWAPVSLQGYKDGDYSMTIGYPGSTSRYLSSYGISERRNAVNEPRYQVRAIKQDIMKRHMLADNNVRIKYETKYAQSSNYWKNSIGMNKCIDSIDIIGLKQQFEQRIRQWQDTTGYLKGQLDFDLLAQLYAKRFNATRALTFYNETFGRRNTDELTRRAVRVHNGIILNGPKNKKRKQYIEFKNNDESWDAATDREILAALLKFYREKVEVKYQPDFYNVIDHDFAGDYGRFVEHLYSKSSLLQSDRKIYVNRKSYLRDPGVVYGMSLVSCLADLQAELDKISDSIKVQERYLCAAKLRMEQDLPNYSDANFTMRLSYGQVCEFMLGGKPSGYYTTAPSIVSKMKQAAAVADYQAEPIMHELMSAADFGPYADKSTGELHLCFLSNNDITGGNSGSPMFNGRGELIGLAFDGNWDSLSSDIFFDRQLARCIGVDIRYVLYLMDKWGKASHLLEEINAK